jgi:hypothetical protein
MAVTTKIQSSITFSNGTTSQNGYVTDTGNTPATIGQNFPAASTNTAFTMAFNYANLQSFWLVASQNCTIKTNSTGSPANTINLVAGVPYYWSLSSGLTNPFTVNITTAYMTCTAATNLQGAILQS